MRLISKYWLLGFLFLGVLSCSASQKIATNGTTENIDLIVTFFSRGSGIDRKIYPEFKQFLRENYGELKYSETKYGREGERDLCFDLSSLKKKEKETFLKDAKLILSKSEIVRIQENSPCINKNK